MNGGLVQYGVCCNMEWEALLTYQRNDSHFGSSKLLQCGHRIIRMQMQPDWLGIAMADGWFQVSVPQAMAGGTPHGRSDQLGSRAPCFIMFQVLRRKRGFKKVWG